MSGAKRRREPSRAAVGSIEEIVRRLTFDAPARLSVRNRLEKLGQWPPDAFAFTSSVLADSGAYRVAVEPAAGERWPPRFGKRWNRWIERHGAAWRKSAHSSRVPVEVKKLLDRIAGSAGLPIESLGEQNWGVTTALLELHALADEASFGLGLPSGTEAEPFEEVAFRLHANYLLSRRGTLAHVPQQIVRVFPKMRTAQAGITLRSMSHQLAMDRSEVDVRWYVNGFCDESRRTLNLLLLPWPLRVEPRDFTPADGRLLNMPDDQFGFFDFNPASRIDTTLVRQLIERARTSSGRVDGVILPELAVNVSELNVLKAVLQREGVPLLLTGVRAPRANYAQMSVWSSADWTDYRQHKHHRWSLDSTQVQNYHLGAALHPSRRWWENIELRRRELHVIAANSWLAISPLICEDLARQDPVAQVLRSIGPTLVIALLLDGPQLGGRWPGRYAAVLADDPGSSVLTLSSYGMVQRSVPAGGAASDVVALWKDPLNGARELRLHGGSSGLLLTLSADMSEEFTADGRSDGWNAAQLVLSAVEQVS